MDWFHGHKKRGKSDKAASAAALLLLVTGAPWVVLSLTASGLETTEVFGSGKKNRKAWERTAGAGTAYWHGQYRLVDNTSTGVVLPFSRCPLSASFCGTSFVCRKPGLFLAQSY